MSTRVSPIERIRADIDDLFASGRDLGEVLEEVARLGVRLLMQSAIEAEVTEFLGRERYARGERARPGSRNGHCPTTIKTTAGAVTVERPKLRSGSSRTRLGTGSPLKMWKFSVTSTTRRAYQSRGTEQRIPTIYPRGIPSQASVGRPTIAQRLGPPDESVPMESRVEMLEAQLRHLENRHNDFIRNSTREMDDIRTRIDELDAEHDRTAEQLRALVADVATGGLRIEACGLVCLTVGVVLSTWPGFFADMFTRAF